MCVPLMPQVCQISAGREVAVPLPTPSHNHLVKDSGEQWAGGSSVPFHKGSMQNQVPGILSLL